MQPAASGPSARTAPSEPSGLTGVGWWRAQGTADCGSRAAVRCSWERAMHTGVTSAGFWHGRAGRLRSPTFLAFFCFLTRDLVRLAEEEKGGSPGDHVTPRKGRESGALLVPRHVLALSGHDVSPVFSLSLSSEDQAN
ncbi:hypothetical protein MRX96_003868 [Rhipicephalus microplus]